MQRAATKAYELVQDGAYRLVQFSLSALLSPAGFDIGLSGVHASSDICHSIHQLEAHVRLDDALSIAPDLNTNSRLQRRI